MSEPAPRRSPIALRAAAVVTVAMLAALGAIAYRPVSLLWATRDPGRVARGYLYASHDERAFLEVRGLPDALARLSRTSAAIPDVSEIARATSGTVIVRGPGQHQELAPHLFAYEASSGVAFIDHELAVETTDGRKGAVVVSVRRDGDRFLVAPPPPPEPGREGG